MSDQQIDWTDRLNGCRPTILLQDRGDLGFFISHFLVFVIDIKQETLQKNQLFFRDHRH